MTKNGKQREKEGKKAKNEKIFENKLLEKYLKEIVHILCKNNKKIRGLSKAKAPSFFRWFFQQGKCNLLI